MSHSLVVLMRRFSESVTLRERHHNGRFKALMDRFMPRWRTYKREFDQVMIPCQDYLLQSGSQMDEDPNLMAAMMAEE
jgi:hypothetical protein